MNYGMSSMWDFPHIAAAIKLPQRIAVRAQNPIIIAVLDTILSSDHALPHQILLPQLSTFPTQKSQENNATELSHATQMVQVITTLLSQVSHIEAFRILPIAICHNSFCHGESYLQGLQILGHHRVHVVLMSIGMKIQEARSSEILDDWIVHIKRRDAVVIGSVANSGVYAHTFPACTQGVLPVAACDYNGQRLPFSGFCSDVKKRGVLAPGIFTLEDKQQRMVNVTGTSVSAAIVASIAALIRANHPEWNGPQTHYALWRSGKIGHLSQAILNVEAALRS